MLLLLAALAGCGTPGAPTHERELSTLWQLRDQRRLDPFLSQALQSADEDVRHYAARALSAMAPTEPAALPLLIQAAADPSAWVRGEALFGLGQAPPGPQLDVLRKAMEEDDTLSRYLALLGLGKVGSPQLVDAVAVHLDDPEPRVRGVAAIAALHLAGDRLRGEAKADPAMLTRLRRALMRALSREADEAAHVRMAYALSHLGHPEAAEVLQQVAVRGHRYSRLFALRGLSMLPPTLEIGAALQQALADPDPALAYEAAFGLVSPARRADRPARNTAGLHHDDDRSHQVLLEYLEQGKHMHVLELLLREMGRGQELASRIEPLLRRAMQKEGNLHGAALVGLARLRGRDVVPDLEQGARDQDFRVRAGAARAARYLPATDARPLLARLIEDADVRVATAAAESLPSHRGESWATELCRIALSRNDYGLLEGTAAAATTLSDQSLIQPLRLAFDAAGGRASAEARKLLLAAAADIAFEQEEVQDWLRRATKDPAHVVRKEARRRLGLEGEDLLDRRRDFHPLKPGKEIPWGLLQSRPRLRVSTTRGDFEIELMTAFAPVHCFNMLELVRRGAYDGRIFHRVVPNFVVQGGDHRGDGAGAIAWHGGTLRDELSPVPFDAGMVGMPKSADPDTGGDQFFITTVPTPHLDGRYTVFGRVTVGLSVVESIVVGDRIERIVVIGD